MSAVPGDVHLLRCLAGHERSASRSAARASCASG